jgi:uncharacterized protein (TIGR02118 family)
VITRVGLAPRARGLDDDAFRAHWASQHAEAAASLPGLRGYVQNHSVLRDGRPLLPYPGFDACSELDFDSVAAMDEAFASTEYRTTVAADEEELIDRTRLAFLLAERRTLASGPPDDAAVKLLTFLRLQAGRTHDELLRVLDGPYGEAAAGVAFLRHEQLVELPGAHAGRAPAVCSAIDVVWFRDAGEALELVTGEAGRRLRYELAGVVFGVEHLLARPVRVV